MRLATVRRPAYTFPGGEPRINETMASRAILMFWKEPRMWIFLRRKISGLYAMSQKDIHGRIGQNDASAAGVFYGELGLAILTSDSALKRYLSRARISLNPSWVRTDGPGEVVSMERFDILNLERVEIKVI